MIGANQCPDFNLSALSVNQRLAMFGDTVGLLVCCCSYLRFSCSPFLLLSGSAPQLTIDAAAATATTTNSTMTAQK